MSSLLLKKCVYQNPLQSTKKNKYILCLINVVSKIGKWTPKYYMIMKLRKKQTTIIWWRKLQSGNEKHIFVSSQLGFTKPSMTKCTH